MFAQQKFVNYIDLKNGYPTFVVNILHAKLNFLHPPGNHREQDYDYGHWNLFSLMKIQKLRLCTRINLEGK